MHKLPQLESRSIHDQACFEGGIETLSEFRQGTKSADRVGTLVFELEPPNMCDYSTL